MNLTIPVWYGEKQQEEYIVKERRTADLGRMVPLWTLVYCDWDNQVSEKPEHLHGGRKSFNNRICVSW